MSSVKSLINIFVILLVILITSPVFGQAETKLNPFTRKLQWVYPSINSLDDTDTNVISPGNANLFLRVNSAGTSVTADTGGSTGGGGTVTIEIDDLSVTSGTLTINFLQGNGLVATESPTDQVNVSVSDIFVLTAGDSMTGTLDLISDAIYQIDGTDVLTSTTLGSGVLSSSLTSVGTVTSGTWQGTTIAVDQGGTGVTSLTDGGILLGSGTGGITALGAASNGQIPIGDGTTDPQLATITGGTNITITNGSASITVAVDDVFVLTAGDTMTGNLDVGGTLKVGSSGDTSVVFGTGAINGTEILDGTIGDVDIADTADIKTGGFGITIDGGGVAITTGDKGFVEIPYDCTIRTATLLADQSGSIVIDVRKDTFANFPPVDADSICDSGTCPTLSTANKSQDTTFTSWQTTTVSKGDIAGFTVDSITTVQRVHLNFECEKD